MPIEENKAVCSKCIHYRPGPNLKSEIPGWMMDCLPLPGLGRRHDCAKGGVIGIDYVKGREKHSSKCTLLNYSGNCQGFEPGEPKRQTLVAVSDSVWYKPWSWRSCHWEERKD